MRKFKSFFKPNKEFIERTRFVFLAAFREKFGIPQKKNAFGFRYFIRGLALGTACMAVISGASVYADQTNVGPDNLLYPLKRTHEVVNLLLAGAQEQPELHLKFAERRLDEVKEIKEKDPSNPKVLALVKDLREEVKNSFGTLESRGKETSREVLRSVIPSEKQKQEAKKEETPIVPAPQASRILTAPRPEAEKEENDNDKNRDGKNIMAEGGKNASASVTSSLPVSTATSSIKKEDSRERSSGARDAKICASWNGIIKSGEEEVKKIIEEHPEFFEKFEKKCL